MWSAGSQSRRSGGAIAGNRGRWIGIWLPCPECLSKRAVCLAVKPDRLLGTLGIGKVEPYDFSVAEKARLAERGNSFVEYL